MNNIQNYDSFLNEGFFSKSFLALSLALSTLFTNINGVMGATTNDTTKNVDYSDEIETIKNNYEDVLSILTGLSKHLNDKELHDLIIVLRAIRYDFDNMDSDVFIAKIKKVEPKLINIIKKHGTSDYNIEQIINHSKSNDIRRLQVDFQYIKGEFDKISEKYKVTGWEKLTEFDKTDIRVLGTISLFISLSILTVGTIKIYKIRKEKKAEIRRREIIRLEELRRRQRREMEDARQRMLKIEKERKLRKALAQFKEGDKVLYENPKSQKRNGKSAIFINVREDDKCRIQFDDQTILACLVDHIKPYSKTREEHIKLDPYGEENWDA